MNIPVEYMNCAGEICNTNINVSRLAFAKSLAIAGQGYTPLTFSTLKALSFFINYAEYLNRTSYSENHFSEPPEKFSDPTEKAHFSNIVGKAIGDLLSKRINGAVVTINYEAAMRVLNYPIHGKRPDLIAFTSDSLISIETKGRHQNNPGDMSSHIAQSISGPVKVNYCIASIAYNLYSKVNCKYYATTRDIVPFDDLTFKMLTRIYYQSFLGYMNENIYKRKDVIGHKSYAIGFPSEIISESFIGDNPVTRVAQELLSMESNLKIILPHNILELAENGLARDSLDSKYENKIFEDAFLFIDCDGIGIGRDFS